MTPQIITVHDIHQAIEDVGVFPYANTVVQDMGGEYWFVDAEKIEGKDLTCEYDIGANYSNIYVTPMGDPLIRDVWKYQIHPIPLKLAHFIIETLRLKAQFGRLGVGDIDEPAKQAVYLTKGTKIFGHEVTELTEIKAELRPVIVERL